VSRWKDPDSGATVQVDGEERWRLTFGLAMLVEKAWERGARPAWLDFAQRLATTGGSPSASVAAGP
jgi:hypothetical protein